MAISQLSLIRSVHSAPVQEPNKMSSKIVILLFVLAAAAALEIRQPLLLKQQVILKEEEGPSEYAFAYAVHDEHTGDIKSQKESRKGDIVEGVYDLIDSDGYRRVVQYRADKHSGFQALVHREPTHIKIPIPEPQHKLVATKLVSAPIVHYSQPLKLIKAEPRSYGYGKSAEGYDNHVTFTGPGASYSY